MVKILYGYLQKGPAFKPGLFNKTYFIISNPGSVPNSWAG